MDVALEAGAEDIKTEDEGFEVLAPITAYDSLSQALSEAGIEVESSELAYLPETLTPINDASEAKSIMNLIEALDDLDDVQNVFHSADIAEGLLEEE